MAYLSTMALTFQPRPGFVVMCDFRGYELPEMVKIRPVVVLARNRKARQLVTVVPLSTTRPEPLERHHHELARNPLPGNEHLTCWAKCDMVATVALARLDRFKSARRTYVTPELELAEFQAVQLATATALGLLHPRR